jgi:hypothetical protein
LLSGFLFVGGKLFGGRIPEAYYSVSGAIFLLVASLSGAVQVLRREGPGPFGSPVSGLWPVISGILIILFCWSIALILLI